MSSQRSRSGGKYWLTAPLPRWAQTPWFEPGAARFAGVAAGTAGFALLVAALRSLGPAYRFGTAAPDAPLATHGAYARLRHPVYAYFLLQQAANAFPLRVQLRFF